MAKEKVKAKESEPVSEEGTNDFEKFSPKAADVVPHQLRDTTSELQKSEPVQAPGPIEPPPRPEGWSGIPNEAATTLLTGRELPKITPKKDAHPLLVEVYDRLITYQAGGVIAPWARLAQLEIDSLLKRIREEIEKK